MELKTGSVLRDYQIDRLLGKGGMGTVYLGKEWLLDRSIAIKELYSYLSQDSGFVRRFRNEAKLQSILKHKNVVSLYCFFYHNDKYYMVMEYAKGITLKQLIKQIGPIPEKRALGIISQILSALEYAHAQGVIHRDIKPSNIMIDKNDHVMVLDFGIARAMGDRGFTQTGQQLGTISYMSPEQVKSDKNINEKTDIYSLGVTLFEMLSGRNAYDLDTQSNYDIMSSIVSKELPDPREYYPHISDQTVELLKLMTVKNREERIGVKQAQEFTSKSASQDEEEYTSYQTVRSTNKGKSKKKRKIFRLFKKKKKANKVSKKTTTYKQVFGKMVQLKHYIIGIIAIVVLIALVSGVVIKIVYFDKPVIEAPWEVDESPEEVDDVFWW